MLTGYFVEVIRYMGDVEEDDIYLDEFADEIDPWIINVLKSIGCDTAKSVLRLSREDLIQRSDLEEETIDHIIAVLQSEFEED